MKFSDPEVEKDLLMLINLYSRRTDHITYERLHNNFQYLKLNTIESSLATTLNGNYFEITTRGNKATIEVVDYLLEQKKKHREVAAVERIKPAKMGKLNRFWHFLIF